VLDLKNPTLGVNVMGNGSWTCNMVVIWKCTIGVSVLENNLKVP